MLIVEKTLPNFIPTCMTFYQAAAKECLPYFGKDQEKTSDCMEPYTAELTESLLNFFMAELQKNNYKSVDFGNFTEEAIAQAPEVRKPHPGGSRKPAGE